MKKYTLISLILLVQLGLLAQKGGITVPAWEEDYQFEALADQADGGMVSVDITNTGKDLQDCISKAKSQALFTIIFKGYPGTSRVSASSPLSDLSNYNQNLDFFKNYFSSNIAGLAFINKAKTSSSKPTVKVSKKIISSTTTVYIMKSKLREDLEKQGYVESASNLTEALGYKPSLFIVPSDAWMEKLGFMKVMDNQGARERRPDYEAATTNEDLNTIQGFIESRFGDAFEIKDLKQAIDGMAILDARDNSRGKYGTRVESDFDRFARSVSADLWLQVGLIKKSVSGGMEQQYTLNFSGLDPYTKGKVISTEPKIINTVGDDFMRLLNSAVNAACDDFRPRVIKYLTERETKGLNGRILFMSQSEDIDFKLTRVDFKGKSYPLERVLPGMVQRISGKPAKQVGAGNETEMIFSVTIPTKQEDPFSGQVMPYNFNNFALEVISEVKALNSNFNIITEQVGVGEVIITFIDEQ